MGTKHYGGHSGSIGNISFSLDNNSQKLLDTLSDAKREALHRIGDAAKHEIQGIIKEKGIYDTGELYRTIAFDVRVNDSEVDIGSPKDYAIFQEFGTTRIPARAFVAPGILNNDAEYEQIAGETLTAYMK